MPAEMRLLDPVRDEKGQADFRKACMLTDRALERIYASMRCGMTELELLDRVMEAKDGVVNDYAPGEDVRLGFIIIESGPRTAMLHGRATDKRIMRGDFVTIDFGLAYASAMADMTRTFVAGQADAKQKEIYAAVKNAIDECEKTFRPGLNGDEADRIARDIIRGAGYGDNFIHGLGHGFGDYSDPNTGDATALAPGASDTVLRCGMVFTIEPGIYVEGFGGVRIEDTVIMREQGVEPLFSFTKELLSIDE